MIRIKVNFSGDKPIFIQISEAIEDDILCGIYKENEAIISTTQLSKLLKINPTTAVKAIKNLSDEGIVYKKRGLGMFVTEGAVNIIYKKREKRFYNVYLKAFLEEAFKLGLNKDNIKQIIDKECEDQ